MINKMLELKRSIQDGTTFDPKSSLLSESLKNWFVPVQHIRDYYGEEVAIYFEWMNYFLTNMMLPGALGLVFYILNQFFFEPESSPLNAFFAIVMSIWSAIFAINWNRHERSLCVLWDNLYQKEHKIEGIREEFVGSPIMNPITEQVEPEFPWEEKF